MQGLRASLEATLHIKGLLEMMFDVLSGWIDEFISDMEVRLACCARSTLCALGHMMLASCPLPCRLCLQVHTPL
jgi:hypothetical protein